MGCRKRGERKLAVSGFFVGKGRGMHGKLWTICLLALAVNGGAAAQRNNSYTNGQWWNGSQFERRTFYAVDGFLTSKRPAQIERTIDLHGGFVIPPLAEGHNHWLEPAHIEEYNACYLADGVFYVRDMANMPFVVDQFRSKVNLPNTVDWVSAMTSFTGPGGHPVEIIDQFVSFGILPKDWKPDYDKQAAFVVSNQQGIDENFPILLRQHPAYVKAYLLYSDRYAESLKEPQTRGNSRGMDPALLPYFVKKAHQARLKMIVHIYSAADFRNAVAAGVDEVAHFPGDGYQAGMPVEQFLITPEDARAAAKAGVSVTTTLSWLTDLKEESPEQYRIAKDRIVLPNMKVLRAAGVSLFVGSDKFRRDVVPELQALKGLGVFSDQEILTMDVAATAKNIFPDRKIGELKDGYEANFLVLDRNPMANLDNLDSVSVRVKHGQPVSVPKSFVHRQNPDCLQGAP